MVDRRKQLEEMVNEIIALKELDPNYCRIRDQVDEFRKARELVKKTQINMRSYLKKKPVRVSPTTRPWEPTMRARQQITDARIQLAEVREKMYFPKRS